jgi:hypothetical protein
MSCRFFEGGRLCRCAAVRSLITPTIHERERYCHSEEPARCPTYRARMQRGEALPEELYYALWLPWSEDALEDPGALMSLRRVPDPASSEEVVYPGFTPG